MSRDILDYTKGLVIGDYAEWIINSINPEKTHIALPDLRMVETATLPSTRIAIRPNFPDYDHPPGSQMPVENNSNSTILISGDRIQLHIDALAVLEGDIFRNYSLINNNRHSLLGEGGCAFVFKGYDNFISSEVAIKILKPSKHNLDRFWDTVEEARCLVNLNHPNIINIYDLRFIPFPLPRNGDIYLPVLIMEQIEGENLRGYQFKDLNELIEVLSQITDTITFLQSNGLYYKDLKPANIMISEVNGNPVIKFVDFGGIKGKIREYRDAKTTTLSTRLYADPQTNNKNAIDDCDICATIHQLGIMTYEFLGGDMVMAPFTKALDNEGKECVHHISELQTLIQFPGLTDEVYKVLCKATAYNPEDRYQSANEFLEALLEALNP